MRASAPGQSALLMAGAAERLSSRGIRCAVIGAIAAAVQRVVRPSLDADAVVSLQMRDATALEQARAEAGYRATVRTGDADDPIPGLLEIEDARDSRVALLLGLRAMDPDLLGRTRQVTLAEAVLEIAGRGDFTSMKAFAGGPIGLADARAVIQRDRESLDVELLGRLARRFGRDTEPTVAELLGEAHWIAGTGPVQEPAALQVNPRDWLSVAIRR